ncbi:MAG TPA: hypothetical protein VIY53_17850 [Acidobacteriaceae bacterium]
MRLSDQILKYVDSAYVTPARQRGETTIRIKAGDVHRDLRWTNRVPSVCTTLASQKFQRAIGAELIAKDGPPSGYGTRAIFTYRLPLASRPPDHAHRQQPSRLERLYGIASEVFRELGGGEKFIREERDKLNFRHSSNDAGNAAETADGEK